MRGAETSRAHPHRGAFGVFRSLGQKQRALGGAKRISAARAASFQISSVRDADGGAQPFVRETSEGQFHRGASGVSRERSRAAREIVRRAPEHVRGYRRGARGAWPATVFGARFPGEVSRPRADGQRHLRSERIQMVFSRAGNARRILRVLPPPPRVLAHLRLPSSRRSPEKDLLQERAEAGPRHRRQSLPELKPTAGFATEAQRSPRKMAEGRASGVVHPRGDGKYAQSPEGTGDRGVTWRM